VDRVQEVLKLDRCNKEASIYPSNNKKKKKEKATHGPAQQSTAQQHRRISHNRSSYIHTYTRTHIRTYQNMCTDLRRLDMEAYSWNTTDSVGA
jgi:hypothetical protein